MLKTDHSVLLSDARSLEAMADESVALVVTSPPYPMIEMWDELFDQLTPEYGDALRRDDGTSAFDVAHRELRRVWAECHRVLIPGGIACVNVGDATRSVGGEFQLYPNHARIVADMREIGFRVLPDILWRKPTNAPNKFMGSGMLPAGAYVTYEHEYVLIFRKGTGRRFKTAEEKARRRESAYFWEERNEWFSDVWMDLRGASQVLNGGPSRVRSAAFPFELAYRLISMYSALGDTVLDPFLGTGTTSAAALATGRCSVGVELDPGLAALIAESVTVAVGAGQARNAERLRRHRSFAEARTADGKPCKHFNEKLAVPVVTSQEREMVLWSPASLQQVAPLSWRVEHQPAREADAPGGPQRRRLTQKQHSLNL